ncbi:unnamed protein product, partial [marine sediment metagenome]
RPLAYLVNKYYQPNPQVLVGGFTPPDFDLPANFTFHSIGKMEDYPVEKWSDGVIKLLHEIPDEVFFFLLEDAWPVRPINVQAINILHRYMLQFKNVARIDLTSDRFYSGGAEIDWNYVAHLDLVKSSRSEYFSSMMPALWNRKHHLRYFVPSETPWQIELSGSKRLQAMTDIDILGTRQMPYKCSLAFRSGNSGRLAGKIPYKFNQIDLAEMRNLGLLEPWE